LGPNPPLIVKALISQPPAPQNAGAEGGTQEPAKGAGKGPRPQPP